MKQQIEETRDTKAEYSNQRQAAYHECREMIRSFRGHLSKQRLLDELRKLTDKDTDWKRLVRP